MGKTAADLSQIDRWGNRHQLAIPLFVCSLGDSSRFVTAGGGGGERFGIPNVIQIMDIDKEVLSDPSSDAPGFKIKGTLNLKDLSDEDAASGIVYFKGSQTYCAAVKNYLLFFNDDLETLQTIDCLRGPEDTFEINALSASGERMICIGGYGGDLRILARDSNDGFSKENFSEIECDQCIAQCCLSDDEMTVFAAGEDDGSLRAFSVGLKKQVSQLDQKAFASFLKADAQVFIKWFVVLKNKLLVAMTVNKKDSYFSLMDYNTENAEFSIITCQKIDTDPVKKMAIDESGNYLGFGFVNGKKSIYHWGDSKLKHLGSVKQAHQFPIQDLSFIYDETEMVLTLISVAPDYCIHSFQYPFRPQGFRNAIICLGIILIFFLIYLGILSTGCLVIPGVSTNDEL